MITRTAAAIVAATSDVQKPASPPTAPSTISPATKAPINPSSRSPQMLRFVRVITPASHPARMPSRIHKKKFIFASFNDVETSPPPRVSPRPYGVAPHVHLAAAKGIMGPLLVRPTSGGSVRDAPGD